MKTYGKIRIFRTFHAYGMLCDVNILIDNNEVGSIRVNEKKEFQLEEGNHFIQISSNFYKSNKISFQLRENDNVFFNIFIDLPYWKQFFIIFFLFIEGGIYRIEKVSEPGCVNTEN